jgi:hypothetical protein
MKKQSVFLLVSLLSFILFAAGSCEKEDEEPQLPPITQTGEDTFGCMVDGEVWMPKAYDLFPMKHVVLERVDDERIWHIGARQGSASNFYFSIYEDSLKVGKISIPVDESNDVGIYHASQHFDNSSFRWNDELPGELIITRLDTINKIISGTFWFDLLNSGNEKVEIRDGRFDLVIDQIQ